MGIIRHNKTALKTVKDLRMLNELGVIFIAQLRWSFPQWSLLRKVLK